MSELDPAERQIINAILKTHVPSAEVRLFGSRHRGSARPWSDLDLIIIEQKALDIGILAHLASDFEDSELPYRVDLLDWHCISNEFRQQIEKHGYEVIQTGSS